MKKLTNFFLTCLLVAFFAQVGVAQNRVTFPNGQQLFVNGMNLPWVSFGYDFGPGTTNLTEIENRFTEVQNNGGNTVRFWVHCDGVNTPSFDANGTVNGAGVGTPEDLKAVCDLAEKHNITLMICLWSFDMLKNSQGTSATRLRNYQMLTDVTKMNAYMNTALTDMVNAVKGHKGILAWEIFNEPEAMTSDGQPWKDSGFEYYVQMSNIARFVNVAADKIKSLDPSARVTNGTKSLMTNTDSQIADDWGFVEKNWYSNSNLSAAGGKTNGTLNFYTIHFYDWMTAKYSPFTNNCSVWALDKPLVVAEFWMDCFSGICGNDLYTTPFDKGYAGAMGWTDDARNTRPAICSAMKNIQTLHASDVNIINSNILVTGVVIVPTSITVPKGSTSQLTATVSPSNATNKSVTWTSSNTAVATVSSTGLVTGVAVGSATITVKTVEGGKTDVCTATVANVPVTGVSLTPSSVTLNVSQTQQLTPTVAPSNASNKTVSYTTSNASVATVSASGLVTAVAAGNATITVKTQDGNFTATCAVTVNTVSTNLAKSKPVAVSSTEGNYGNIASYAVDGSATTRWSSVYSDPQWIYVDLQANYNITKVVLNWEVASAKDYRVEVSSDASNWTTIATKTGMATGARIDNLTGLTGNGRYVRMYGTARTTSYGYSLYEFEVYGTSGTIVVTGVTIVPTSITIAQGATSQLTATVAPSNATNKSVTWTSSNTAVATVNSTGLVTAITAGSANVTVKTVDGNKTDVCAVTVTSNNTSKIYEAENASLSGTFTATSISGYSGTGYVDGFDVNNDKITFTVTTTTAGQYAFVVRYASPYGDKPNFVYVNGSNLGEKTFTQSAGFVEISFGNINLNAGANTIEIVKSWGYFMVDYIKLTGASGLKSAKIETSVMNANDSKVSIFPNPSNGNFKLKMNESMNGAVVNVYDLTGKVLYSKIATSNELNIDLSSKLMGIGMIRIEKGDIRITEKLIVK